MNVSCTSCGVDLGNFKSAPKDNFNYHWLICDSFKTRLPFCSQCQPSEAVIDKLVQDGRLKKWGMKPEGDLTWGDSITLEEYCRLQGHETCKECHQDLGENAVRDGWFMYHRSCRGGFVNARE